MATVISNRELKQVESSANSSDDIGRVTQRLQTLLGFASAALTPENGRDLQAASVFLIDAVLAITAIEHRPDYPAELSEITSLAEEIAERMDELCTRSANPNR